MSSITDNEEFKKRMDSDCRGWYAYEPSEQSCYRQGAEAAETILTAQHDKEMGEFEDWYRQFIMYQPYEDEKWVVLTNPNQDAKSFTELLALFRNRNK